MVSYVKITSIVLLVFFAIANCGAECPQGDSSPPTSSSLIAEPEAEDRLKPIQSASPVACEPGAQKPQVVSKSELLECSAKPVNEVPKTEQSIIEKDGKKYKVITVTLPMESDNVEAKTDSTPVEPTVTSEVDPDPADSVEPLSPEDFEELAQPEEVAPKKQEKANKKAGKKYKRDTGKKSVDKKSRKRKSKGQGKDKTKK